MALPPHEKRKFDRARGYNQQEEKTKSVSRYHTLCVLLLLGLSVMFVTLLQDELALLDSYGVISHREHSFLANLMLGEGLTPETGITALDEQIDVLMANPDMHGMVSSLARGLMFFLFAGLVPGLAMFWTSLRDSIYSNVYINTWGVMIFLMAGLLYFGAGGGLKMDVGVDDLVKTPKFYDDSVFKDN